MDEVALGLSPRNIRLATGSLRRSFFTLGRLLALASKQQSMALQPRRVGQRGSRSSELSHYCLRSRIAMPREQLTPLRLRGDLVSLECEAARGTRYTHGADPPFHRGLGPPSGRWPGRSKNETYSRPGTRRLVLRVSREGNAAARHWTCGGQGQGRVVAWDGTDPKSLALNAEGVRTVCPGTQAKLLVGCHGNLPGTPRVVEV